MPAARPPAAPRAVPDPRLAPLARLDDRRRTFEAFRRAVEPLRDGRLEPVTGESELLDELEATLAEAFAVLRQLPDGDPGLLLPRLATLIDDVGWEVAEELRPDLEAKGQRQAETLRAMRVNVNAWEAQLAALAEQVDGARLSGAPFSALEALLKAARGTVASVRTALQDRIYTGLPALQQAAQQAVDTLDREAKQTRAQVDKVKGLVKQADLLIMQVGVEDDEYEYRVLLRSADRFRTRGINIIQDVRRLSRKDRDWLVQMLGQLTASMNDSRRAAHAARTITAAPVGEPVAAPAADPGAGPDAVPPAPAVPNARPREATEMLGILGEFLFRLVIPEQVQAYLRGREGWSFSITTNDLELPWELLCFDDAGAGGDGSGGLRYLCLERCVSRMPLGGVFPQTVTSAAAPRAGAARARRMLLIHSDPEGTLSAAAGEVEAIAQALGGQLEFERVSPEQATNAHLNDVLMGQSFDFVHYAGHALFDVARPARSGLLLKDTLLTADKIRRLSRGGSLVFLNACESGTVAREQDAQRAAYLLSKPEPVVGLASAFVYSGALGCVGSLWPVYDQPAADLAVEFYRRVLAGEPSGEALRLARLTVRDRYPREITWAGYVLYGDPTYRLTES